MGTQERSLTRMPRRVTRGDRWSEVGPRRHEFLEHPAGHERKCEGSDRPPGHGAAGDELAECDRDGKREPPRAGDEVPDGHPSPIVFAAEAAASTHGIGDVSGLAHRPDQRECRSHDDGRSLIQREADRCQWRTDDHAHRSCAEREAGPNPRTHDRRRQVDEGAEDGQRDGAEQGEPRMRRAKSRPGRDHRLQARGDHAAEDDAGRQLRQGREVGHRHDRVSSGKRAARGRDRLPRGESKPDDHRNGADDGPARHGDGHAEHSGSRTHGDQHESRDALRRRLRPSPGQSDREVRHEDADCGRRRASQREVQRGPARSTLHYSHRRRHDGGPHERPGCGETERQDVALCQSLPTSRLGGAPTGRHRSDLDQWPPSIASPPSPAWNRPRAPFPTKLKAWVTIGYRPSSSNRISMIAPWAGERSTACAPQLPSFPSLRWTPSLMTWWKIVPTTWKLESTLGPALRTKTRTVSPTGTSIGWSAYWLATPFQTTKSGAGALAEAFSRSIVAPCWPRYHSFCTSANSWSTSGSPSAGSTMIIPNMPFAMCMRAGLVPQWYMYTPAYLASNS